MRTKFFLGFGILLLALPACTETELSINPEYVIDWYYDENSNDPDWFKVVDIRTKKFQPVPAVKELEGKYYLPIMSRMPSFHNKVVNGEFFIDQPHGSIKPDTVFKVTKHVRDTAIVHGVDGVQQAN